MTHITDEMRQRIKCAQDAGPGVYRLTDEPDRKDAVDIEELDRREKARDQERLDALKAAGAKEIRGDRDAIMIEVGRRIADREPIPRTVVFKGVVTDLARFLDQQRWDFEPPTASVSAALWFKPNSVAEVAVSLLSETRRLDLFA